MRAVAIKSVIVVALVAGSVFVSLGTADENASGFGLDASSGWSPMRPPAIGRQIQCSNVVLEPGFEAGPNSAWAETSSNGWAVVQTDRPRTGSFSAWMGGDHREDAEIWQTVDIAADAVSATLTYWYEIDSEDWCGYDVGGLRIDGSDVADHQFELCGENNTGGFAESAAIDLVASAGASVEIRWFVSTDENLISNLYVDDVMLEVCRPVAPQDEIFDDGFESGDVSGWTR